ncbi:FMN-binding protein [Streptomyces gibsoniae]|uniref:FMN-binding protein n=1 Tax=Streptomyces gibsoniae TaxID=3075529 RepID=A0ABU2U4A9_9ACTN|nr:FMN-binding protein [Streptomyces sp. DSM 41699]MDT0468059.1 FMN-binding protein [Streptomyces sp. DSM 41699]
MHPLKRNSSLRRIVLATAATVTGGVMLLSLKPHTAPSLAVGAPAPSGSGAASAPGGADGSTGSGGSTGSRGSSGTTSSGGSGGSTGSKTVTGESVQTRWGPVQVRVTVVSGRITDVTAVDYPQDNPRDQEISSYALPQLRREVLAAQSANIDTVSGASYTSEGYRQSLQSALDSAGL